MPTTLSAYSDLVPELTGQLPSLPPGEALNAIRRGAAKFCKDTHCWRELLPPIPAVAYQQDYSLSFADDAYVQSMAAPMTVFGTEYPAQMYSLPMPNILRFDPGVIPRRTETYAAYDATKTYQINDIVTHVDGSGNYQIWFAAQAINTPEAWTPAHWGIYFLGGIRCDVVLVPNFYAAGVSANVLNQYEAGIMSAAKIWLYRQAGKPWTPPSTRRGVSPVMQDELSQYGDSVREALAALAGVAGGGASVAFTPQQR